MIPDLPAQRLPQSAKGFWRTSLGIWAAAALLGAMAVAPMADEIGVPKWVPVAAVVVAGALVVAFLPELWWRRWRYEVRDDEIDLRHGTLTIRRTLVPIRRVQHVDTSSGVIQSWFGLATVSFHTAAGQTSIPAVPRAEAEDVRARVALLARTRDDV